MRGHIRQKGKNSWQIQIYTGLGPDEKSRRHFETVHGRKGDAQKRLTELLASLDKGVYTPPQAALQWPSTFTTGLKGMLRLTALSGH